MLVAFALALVSGLLHGFLGSDKVAQVSIQASGRPLVGVLRFGLVPALLVLLRELGFVFYGERRRRGSSRSEVATSAARVPQVGSERVCDPTYASDGGGASTPTPRSGRRSL